MGSSLVIIISIVVFAVVLVVLNKVFDNKQAKYTKKSLEGITRVDDLGVEASSFVEEEVDRFGESVRDVPFLGGIYKNLIKGGSPIKLLPYLLILLGTGLVSGYLISTIIKGTPLIAVGVGCFVALVVHNTYMGIKLEKRNTMFLNDFPDAIDMIVRSVRSGHPLLVSLKLIAQNSRPPLSTEFQRVIDEVSYGRPMPEALRKMSDRIGILDVNFFVVILSVQQETGGSMAEVLSNLSNIIRKRKHLRLKVRAMTSEGRFTTWIFSAIPFVQMGAVFAIAPDYLEPLFETTTGMFCLGLSVALIALSIYIARQLCKMEV